ncbi:cupin domain-containing protein [Nannocystis sp. ILAH1]|uniref:cupin domain-containing protein n=1 Tax=unclassified Nannocystis TaxID=2627009 RepID=UPI0022706C85|nr:MULTISPECIES: cupin domain-containing protein [unclassified Nannocystis]MCY0993358.1 cupin domain-containing protein [Nannocystis sp. ILAH1]MCY1063209.1 cupin domain-containing protein [Nannocystis sp. RBIL2]
MKIDIDGAPTWVGSGYPAPFDAPCLDRKRVRLGAAAGLSQFGVNLLHLQPGTWSSQRHWHSREDEFVYVLAGEVVLVTNAGETVLRAGECAGFPHGVADGHHLQNRGTEVAVVLEVGTDDKRDVAEYPDVDLRATPDGYVHRDGTPYPPRK